MRRLTVALWFGLSLAGCSGSPESAVTTSTAELLVAGEYLDVSSLVVSGDAVYWLEGSSGSLQRVGKGGGGRAVLAAELVDPRGLALRDGWLYFHAETEGQRTILRVPVEGGSPETLAVSADLLYPGELS